MIDDNHFELQQAPEHIYVKFNAEHPVLSSAVFNGGYRPARGILIMKVAENFDGRKKIVDNPEVTLADYCKKVQFSDSTVGMMTSAALDSFRSVSRTSQGVEITAMVTAGISNAGCAGDRATWRKIQTESISAGTINVILLTNAALTPAAMVEAVILATEAKTVAMRKLGVKSVVSGVIATGTGTDSIAVASGLGPETIRYCGKHVLCGEMFAAALIEAITESLSDKR